MAALRAALAPGSHMAITHASADGVPDIVAKVVEVYKKTNAPGTPRDRDQVTALFGDFELVDPGLVWAPLWRPDREVALERPCRSGSTPASAASSEVCANPAPMTRDRDERGRDAGRDGRSDA